MFMYAIHFVMFRNSTAVNSWITSQNFPNKELAMEFAQTVVRGLEDSDYVLFYHIVRA